MGEEEAQVLGPPPEAGGRHAPGRADGEDGDEPGSKPRPAGMLYCNPAGGLLEIMRPDKEPQDH